MATQGDGNIGGYIPPTFPQRNGYDRETPILDSGPNQSMEDMIKEATDMQSGSSFNRSRLQLQSDEAVSPFQQPSNTPSSHSSSSSYKATPNSLQSPFGGSSQQQQYTSSQSMAPSGFGNQEQTGYNGSGSNQPHGTQLVKGADASVKLEALKNWTLSTYKYTKQMVSEKMGRRTRTVDTELEKHIQGLKEMQLRYSNLLKLSRQFQSQFQNILVTQKLMSEAFNELAVKSPDLQEEFAQNSELQKVVSRNGDALMSALLFFNENLWTLSTKTIEDTIETIRDYESCRIEYDAYRTDLEAQEGQGQSMKTEQARKEFNTRKDKFESLRNNLQIKMKFLEENKVKVMRKQLLVLHNALAAYFSGNKDELEKTMKEFHIRVMNKGEEASFLETH